MTSGPVSAMEGVPRGGLRIRTPVALAVFSRTCDQATSDPFGSRSVFSRVTKGASVSSKNLIQSWTYPCHQGLIPSAS